MIGVPIRAPNTPGLVMVKVPAAISSGDSVLVRAFSAISITARDRPTRFISSAWWMTGTISPLASSTATAMPRLTYFLISADSPCTSAFTHGQLPIASMVARAMNGM